MSQQEPEYVWSFPPEKKRHPGRVWLIVGLSVAAVAIAVVLFLLFLPRTTPSPGSTDTPTPTPTVSTTPTETPMPTPTATPSGEPTSTTPPETPPPPGDPSVPVFRDKVRPVLTDADTGLRMLSGMSGQDAVQVVDQLRQDAERLSDAVAPSSIATDWRTRSAAYLNALSRLQDAYENGTGVDSALATATASEQSLKKLVGL